jgi:hypothetical protein
MFADRVAQVYLADHQGRQAGQHLRLFLVEAPRRPVVDAERSEVQPIARLQRCARVKTNVWRADDERILGEARIGASVRNYHHFVA